MTGGPQQARGLQMDYLATQRVEWNVLDATQAAALQTWWRETLVFGGAWFVSTWPAPQGWMPAVRRFVGAPRWTHLGGGFWQVTATVQVRGRSAYCAPRGVFSQLVTQAWWDFEQNDGTFSFLDSSNGANHLTTTHATSALSVSGGVTGRAMYRGGVGSPYQDRRIYIPRKNTRLDFGTTESFSIGCWVQPQGAMEADFTHTIMGRSALYIGGAQSTYQDDSYRLGVLNGVLSWSISDPTSTSYRILSGSLAGTGTWQFLIGVCDLAAMVLRLYSNGAQVTAPLAIPSGPQHCVGANFCISHPMHTDSLGDNGTPMDIASRQFNGWVDQAFVVPAALTDADAAWLYNGGAGQTYAAALAHGIMT